MMEFDLTEPKGVHRVLIVGGGGFLGQHAAHYLKATGAEVHIFDPAPSPPDVLADSPPPHQHYTGSVTNQSDVAEAFDAAKPDCVVVMASYSHGGLGLIRSAEENPAGAVDVNVTGLLNVLNAATRTAATQILWLSSTTVYGRAAAYQGRVDENSLLLPSSVYGATKVLGEQLIRQYRDAYGLNATSVRPTLVWGPGLRYRGVQSCLNDMMSAAATSEPIAVVDSEEPWDLLYVRDAGRALAWLAGRDLGAVVLVNGYRASLREVREAVVQAAPDTRIQPQGQAARLDLPAVDDGRIRRAGFNTSFSLESSIVDYLAHA